MTVNAKATPIEPSLVARVTAGLKYAFTGAQPEWFGPGQPLTEVAPQAAGRSYDYPTGYNINTRPRQNEAITFEVLRGLADNYDLLRLLIETRKDQLAALPWTIKPKEKNKKPDDRCLELVKFFRRPDQELGWHDWLRMLLEDLIVIDAPSIYRRKTNGGELFSLEIIDGATIKRVLDFRGRTPMEGPAYQQILKGLPAVDYTRDELVYKPRNRRVHRAYGFSPVEQVIMTVNIALRRQMFTLDYFTQGNIPEALVGVPESWSPDQIRQFQEAWDILLAGEESAGERRKMRFVPGDIAKSFKETKAPPLKDEFDEWLARVVCFAFSIEPTPFIKQQNRATAETAREQSLAEGLAPYRLWVKSLIDEILLENFGYDDIEFCWTDEQAIDPLVRAQIDAIYLTAKVLHPDEVRAELGRDPLTDEQKQDMNPPMPDVGDDSNSEAKPNSDKVQKYNPYHDERGRFTTGDSATFVSTTNERTTARLRESGSAGKQVPLNAGPKLADGHERLSRPEPIARETDKAVAIHNRAYHEARNTAAYDVKELDSAQQRILREEGPLTWLPKSQVSIHNGHVVGAAGWLASRSRLATHESEAKATQREQSRAAAFESGKERYNKLIEHARAHGVKGIRVGMRTSTIHEHMRRAGVEPPTGKAEDIDDLLKGDAFCGEATLGEFEVRCLGMLAIESDAEIGKAARSSSAQDPINLNVTLPTINVHQPDIVVDVAGTTVHAAIHPAPAQVQVPDVKVDVAAPILTLEATLPAPEIVVKAEAAPAQVQIVNEVKAEAAPAQVKVVMNSPVMSTAEHIRDPKTQEVVATVTKHEYRKE